MLTHNARLSLQGVADRSMIVSSDMLLHEVAERYDLGARPYFIVVSAEGVLIGVLSAEEILRRVGAWNEAERKRWGDMPIESAVRTRLDLIAPRLGAAPPSPAPDSRDLLCTAISDNSGLRAVITSDDVLVSWSIVERLIQHALADAVTTLPTRTVFNQRLQQEFLRARRVGHPLGVMLVDLDHLKQINDNHGHHVGDAVLRAVGGCLQESIRSYDVVSRYGGDEFAVICAGCDPDQIAIPINRIWRNLKTVAHEFRFDDRTLSLSVGAAVANDCNVVTSAQELLTAADDCLYRSKRTGRARAHATILGKSPALAGERQPISLVSIFSSDLNGAAPASPATAVPSASSATTAAATVR